MMLSEDIFSHVAVHFCNVSSAEIVLTQQARVAEAALVQD